MVTDELKREVVEAYGRGMKLSDIERQFGLPYAVIYDTLREAKAIPNTTKKKVRYTIDGKTAQLWLDRMSEQEQTINRLEAEIVEQYAEIERLRKRLAATAPARKRPPAKKKGEAVAQADAEAD